MERMILPTIAALSLVAPAVTQEPGPQRVKRKHPELIGKFVWDNAPIPSVGIGTDEYKSFDKAICDYMRQVGAPGSSVTIFDKGIMVYSKGFGFADIDTKAQYLPTTPNRISSVSKYLTKKAVEVLVKQGKLKLDARVVELLKPSGIKPIAVKGSKPDSRIGSVTVGQLLEHKGGIEPGLNIAEAASEEVALLMGFRRPITHKDSLSFVLGLPLISDPGTKEDYSNYGYALLGEVIQVVSGMTLEKFVQTNVIQPVLGNSKDWYVTTASRQDRRKGETDYYSWSDYRTWDVFRWDIMAGAGGWVTSSENLAAFFRKEFPGPGWDFTQWGSYTGVVTVMKVYANDIVIAINVNYRSGVFVDDNGRLTKMLDETVKNLKA